MVWRRTDQLHARLRMPKPRDEFCNLVTGKLTALAGLRALRDLDLNLLGIHQVLSRNAEASRSNLLHLVVQQMRWNIDAIQRQLTRRIVDSAVFPALTRIRPAAKHVHRSGDGLVRLRTQRPQRHCTRNESLVEVLRWFNLP